MPASKKKSGHSWNDQVEHHHAWVAIGAAVLVLVAALYGAFSFASGDRYNFVARGVITEVNGSTSLKINVTHITGKGEDDLKGAHREFKLVSSTKFYKNTAGKDKRVTSRSLAVGQEVGFKGVAKDDDSYIITWLRIHDRSFIVIGKLKDVNRTNKTYTVSVTTSTYRPATYNGKDVVMNYGGNTVFMSGSDERNADDVKVGDQKVHITGTIGDHARWEITKLLDNYTGK